MKYKVIQGKKMAYLEFASKSTPGKKYFVTPFPNPLFEHILNKRMSVSTRWTNSLPHQTLWVCTCSSFTMGKAKLGLNPFESYCPHVQEVMDTLKTVRKKLEVALNANKRSGRLGSKGTKETKKSKPKKPKSKEEPKKKSRKPVVKGEERGTEPKSTKGLKPTAEGYSHEWCHCEGYKNKKLQAERTPKNCKCGWKKIHVHCIECGGTVSVG